MMFPIDKLTPEFSSEHKVLQKGTINEGSR